MQYTPFGKPWFAHQQSHFEKHKDSEIWGLLWEQGTAKTKPVLDTMSYLYQQKKITGMIVVAPPGVERNWLSDEIPEHCHPEIRNEIEAFVWKSNRVGTKDHTYRFDRLIKHNGLSVLLISYNAFITENAKKALWRFLRRRVCLFVLDEAHNIKTAAAKRTKSIVAAGKYAVYRRIMTGTPISNSPFDIYPQIRFLDNNFWKDRGIHTYAEFKQHFGVWRLREEVKREKGYDPKYDQLLSYKNLDQLKGWIDEVTDRVTKDEVLDLPPKLYQKRYYALSSAQEALYNELRDEYIAELNGELIDGSLAIVRLLRLQQIICGYVKTETDDLDDEPVRLIGNSNPRIECLRDVCEQVTGQCLIWARFRKDVDQIMEILGDDAVRYDGTITDDQAEQNKKLFQLGKKKWFVGTASKGGPGLTLHMAKTVIYYNNSFKLIDRLQSEDRAHRAGMDEHPVNYIDICCHDTVDDKIIKNLRSKVDIASKLTGDELKEWL